MFSTSVAFVVGLVVGWNFVPQPQWIRNLVKRYFPSSSK